LEKFGFTGNCSDHIPFLAKTNIPIKSKPATTQIRCFSKAKWGDLDFSLLTTNWTQFFELCPDNISYAEHFTTYCKLLIKDFVPLYRKSHSRFYPKHNPRINRLRCIKSRLKFILDKNMEQEANSIKIKKRLTKKYDLINLHLKHKSVSRDLDKLTKHHRKSREAAILKMNNPKKFWKFVGSRLNNSDSDISTIILENGTKVTKNSELAQVFSDFYSSIMNGSDISKYKAPIQYNTNALNCYVPNPDFEPMSILRLLKLTQPSSSKGIDGIPKVFLKRLATPLAEPLSIIFNDIFRSGTFPDAWKTAIILPTHKKDSKLKVDNYRPISLTPTMSKIFEKSLSEYILNFCAENNIMAKEQFGFTKGKSVESQMLTCLNDWTHIDHKGSAIHIIYLDLSKAFDCVNHNLLLAKCVALGFYPKLINILSSYLTNRSQIVTVDGAQSKCTPVTRGVPQGSVLGPLLYLLFTSELPSIGLSSKVKLYADDIKIYHTIEKLSDTVALQNDLDKVLEWLKSKDLTISVKKSGVVMIGKDYKDEVTYKIDDDVIPNLPEYRDLGIFVDSKLSFKTHISNIVNSASKVANAIFRSFSCRDQKFLVQMFKTYVRPKLEFATVIWNPLDVTNITLIEKVQRTFTRRIPGLSECSYLDRCEILDLQPLILRRIEFDLIAVYKILRGCMIDVNPNDFFKISSTVTRGHPWTIVHNHRAHYNDLQGRITKIWNSAFMEKLVSSNNIKEFRNRLPSIRPHLLDYIDRNYHNLF
jgi:hypothetical protein